ncbi:hypothetical protein PFUM301597_19830 [Pseudomonas fluorescens]
MARAQGPKPLFWHTELGRGAEWWGKCLLGAVGLFSQVTGRKGGALSGRDRSNG